jgi:phosphohistidine phosphatase SixA
MNVRTLLAAAAVVGAAACAGVSQAPERPSVYVMRHLQKAEGADPGLSAEGQANAERLAGWFGRDAPASIYVSATRRARETAAPLAARLGVTPAEYDPRDTGGVAQRALADGGTVLIVGHSNTVPEIVEKLGGTRPAPLEESDYGDIFQVVGPERRTERKKLAP